MFGKRSFGMIYHKAVQFVLVNAGGKVEEFIRLNYFERIFFERMAIDDMSLTKRFGVQGNKNCVCFPHFLICKLVAENTDMKFSSIILIPT